MEIAKPPRRASAHGGTQAVKKAGGAADHFAAESAG